MAQKRAASSDAANEFVGYITNTSPLQTGRDGKSRYFNATLQLQNSETKRIVCFDEQKHQTFLAMESHNTPTKIQHSSLIPSFKSDTMDIKITKMSKVEGMKSTTFKKRKLDFKEDANSSQSTSVMTSLDKIQTTTQDVSTSTQVNSLK